MESTPDSKPRAGLSDYLAAERTLLAWIRTGLALMGFGFVVARFGLFLQEMRFAQLAAPVSHSTVSLWFGTALIASGVLVCVASGVHHSRLVNSLNRGDISPTRSSAPALAIALFLAVVGLAMTAYLVSIRESQRETPPARQESTPSP